MGFNTIWFCYGLISKETDLRNIKFIPIIIVSVFLVACGSEDTVAVKPDPLPITADAVGHFCSMDLIEHDGPKGQIFVKDREDPLWFSTIRQVLAYVILPDSPKGLDAIYVTDMAIVKNMRQPEQDSWMDAREAYFVTESRAAGGMGAEDPLPFSDLDKAKQFAEQYGGKILTFKEIPEDYILRYDFSSVETIDIFSNSQH